MIDTPWGDILNGKDRTMWTPERNPNPPSDRLSQREREDFDGHLCAGDDCDAEGTHQGEGISDPWYCADCWQEEATP